MSSALCRTPDRRSRYTVRHGVSSLRDHGIPMRLTRLKNLPKDGISAAQINFRIPCSTNRPTLQCIKRAVILLTKKPMMESNTVSTVDVYYQHCKHTSSWSTSPFRLVHISERLVGAFAPAGRHAQGHLQSIQKGALIWELPTLYDKYLLHSQLV